MIKMINFERFIQIFLISFLSLIPFIPVLKSMDLIGPQFLYLSLSQIPITIYVLLKWNSIKKWSYLNKPILFLFIYIFISLISITISSNFIESVVEYSRTYTLFLTLFNLVILSSIEKKNKAYIILLICVIQAFEAIYIFNIFLDNYTFENGLERIRALQGLSSNQNVGAFSLITKIPLILYWIFTLKNRKIIVLLYILLALSFFDVFIIGSRGAILASYFFIFYIIFLGFYFRKKLNKIYKKFKNKALIVVFLYLSLIFIQSFLYQNTEDLQVTNRSLNSYSLEDDSINKRSRYLFHTLKHILNNPIIGSGLGTWKVISIFYDKENITEYQVPYHAHNDFLQIGAETGILGSISYVLIFLSCIYYLFKKGKENKDDENDSFLAFMLIAAISIFLIDSNLNFPRARPYSQMNIIYILSISILLIRSEINPGKIKKEYIKYFIFFTLISLIPINYINFKVFKSIQEQAYMYFDFNGNRADLKIPLEDALKWEETIPNLTTSSLPIALIKSNYFIQEKKYDKAISLIKKGKKINPYLGIGDFNLARIYREKDMIDSAYYYSKKSVEKLPQNVSHISFLQKILAARNDLNEAKILFKKSRHIKDKIIWNNHALFLIALDEDGEFIFGDEEINFVNEAYELFPNEKFIKAAHKIVNSGYDNALIADNYDKIANKNYIEKKYKKAILNWEKAIEKIQNEDSYYLNIAQSYQALGDFKSSLEYLKRLEKIGLKSRDGKFEFLTSLAFFKLGEKNISCSYAKQAKKLNYQNTSQLISITCN